MAVADIVAFLKARIIEDQQNAIILHELNCDLVLYAPQAMQKGWECDCDYPIRVATECKAKWAALAELVEIRRLCQLTSRTRVTAAVDLAVDRIADALAAPYAGHPDFDPEWTTT